MLWDGVIWSRKPGKSAVTVVYCMGWRLDIEDFYGGQVMAEYPLKRLLNRINKLNLTDIIFWLHISSVQTNDMYKNQELPYLQIPVAAAFLIETTLPNLGRQKLETRRRVENRTEIP